MVRWLQYDIVDRGRLPLLCCLVAFILTFFVTRTFVRYIRRRAGIGLAPKWWQPRNVRIGSLHIHHMAFGVVLVMVSGLTLVTLSVNGQEPGFTITSIIFGIGAALVLDEYALILHLSDVYWEQDGRSSVDAVFAAVAVAGLLILGLHPLTFFLPVRYGTDWVELRGMFAGALVVTLPLAVVVLLKGKVWTGLLGMFIVVLLVVGAVRLSRPHAPWARWRYTRQPEKMRRAMARERKWRRPVVQVKLWLQCAIAGVPRVLDERAVDKQLDHDVHPASPPEGTNGVLISR